MEAIDRLHTTAESHHRALIVEVMGRHAGWIALHAGMAGGANVILIPEKPFDIEEVCDYVENRFETRYAPIVVVAEGATRRLGRHVPSTQLDAFGHVRLATWRSASCSRPRSSGAPARRPARRPRHIQRGGTPTAFDRVLATRFGLHAIRAVADGESGVDGRAARHRDRPGAARRGGRELKIVPPERYAEAEVFFGYLFFFFFFFFFFVSLPGSERGRLDAVLAGGRAEPPGAVLRRVHVDPVAAISGANPESIRAGRCRERRRVRWRSPPTNPVISEWAATVKMQVPGLVVVLVQHRPGSRSQPAILIDLPGGLIRPGRRSTVNEYRPWMPRRKPASSAASAVETRALWLVSPGPERGSSGERGQFLGHR